MPAASTVDKPAPTRWLGRAFVALRAAAAWAEVHHRLLLGAALLLQLGGTLAIALLATHDGWIYYNGGDGTYYWTGAFALGHLELPRTWVGYGNSVLWAPAGALLGPSMVQGLPFVLLLNTLVLAPLALLLLYGVAERIAGRLFGLFAVALWLVAPVVAYRMTRPDIRPRVLDIFLPGASGLNALADFSSLVAVLAAAYFTLRTIDTRARTDALAAGAIAGFAVGLKPANALFLPSVAVGLVLARRWSAVCWTAAGLVLPLLALAVWKQKGLGSLPLLAAGETRLAAGTAPLVAVSNPFSKYGGVDWGTVSENLSAIREIFWSRALLEWFAVAGTFALLRRSPAKGALVVTWFTAYFLVKGSSPFANVFAMSYFRLLEPAYPAFLLLAAASVALLWPRAGRAPARPPEARPLGVRPALALVVLLGLVPLVVVAVARPAAAGRYAQIANAGTQVPVRDVGLTATARAGGVRLAWRRQPGSGYRLYRSATETADCAASTDGAKDCSVTADTVANVPETGFVDRPGRGTWIYRIAPVAAWNGDIAAGDPVLLSPPAVVTIR